MTIRRPNAIIFAARILEPALEVEVEVEVKVELGLGLELAARLLVAV